MIIFFDGECLLCQGFVKFLWKRDHKRIFSYAPLQGTTAIHYLNTSQRDNLNSVVLFDGQKTYEKSDAAIEVLIRLDGWPKFCGYFFKIFPRFFRDFIYSIIAKNRYQWFGTTQECLYINGSEQKYFLK